MATEKSVKTVKITDSREKKQQWLNQMVESDPFMAEHFYLSQVIEMGKTEDPEMAELARELLDKLKGLDKLNNKDKCYAVRVNGWIHVKAKDANEATNKAKERAERVIHELSDVIEQDTMLRGEDEDDKLSEFDIEHWEDL